VQYGAQFTVAYSGTATNASLVAPSASSTSVNSNQRVVMLRVVSNAGGMLTLTAPADANVAPPQYYMLFLLNGKTHSAARWVKLSPAAASA
jgi:hypothetical protein